jgi:antitoxin YefM
VAVLLGADDYDSLMETIEILSDPELMAEIREAERDIAEGRVYSSEEMRAAMRAAGRKA